MITVVLVVHLMIALAMVGVILLQRSEGGALSGLGGGNFGGMMSARGSANLLTRATAILAACFIVTSLTLAILAAQGRQGGSILDRPLGDPLAPTAPLPPPAAPATPAEPAPPIAQ